MEAAYQSNLVSMRTEWQGQVEALTEEVRHRQDKFAYQTKSKEVREGHMHVHMNEVPPLYTVVFISYIGM